MINHYPLWKYALILIVLGAGTLYALPNLFGEDPAVQVSAARASINDSLRDRVVSALANEEIEVKETELTDRLLVRLHSEEEQLQALEVIENALERQYITALNLAPATPDWLTFIQALPMYLGLDLRGGVHFLMEVDLAGAVRQAEQRYAGDLRTLLRENKIRQRSILAHRSGAPIILQRNVMLTGEYITDAASGIDQQTGSPAVYITLDGKGARLFSERTRDRIGQTMAVVYIEHKSFTELVDGERVRQKEIIEEVINTAVIRDQLGKRFQITGLNNTEEARDLALLLRAGALAAPIDIIEERTVGPSLGQANIDQGFRSVVIGFLLVLILMAIRYRVFGMVANLALTFNLVLVIALLSLLQATLTLPGIAGIVLTVGMAVDANVLIFERIREEIRNGNTPQASIHSGYEKAFSTIADANITTLIAAVLLFGFGTGPIKGFAITLSLGIITSMFTAIMFTRALINLIYGGRRLKSLSIGGQGRLAGGPA
eukprot:XP_019857386.1 PREDICTED: uncharacterized protein LOC109585703 [Amphimedon queenslandica]